jgi:hypothetical protein
MDRFIRECVRVFHNRQLWGNLSLSFCIQFFRQRVNIVLQHAFTFAIERKIALVNDVCSRPPISIISHDLHEGDIRGAMGEIASYHERDSFSPFFFWFMRVIHLLAFLWPSLFVSLVMISTIDLLLDFFIRFF